MINNREGTIQIMKHMQVYLGGTCKFLFTNK